MSAKKRRLKPPLVNLSTSPTVALLADQAVFGSTTSNTDGYSSPSTTISRNYDENANDVDGKLFSIAGRRSNRKPSKQIPVFFPTKTDPSFQTDTVVTTSIAARAYKATSGLSSVSRDSISQTDGRVYLSTSVTSERFRRVGAYVEDPAVLSTTQSLRTSLAAVDRTLTAGDAQRAADGPVVAVVGSAVICAVILLTFVTVCLTLMLCRRISRRSRDVVGDRAIDKPVKSGLAIDANDIDDALAVGKWTCLTKLLDPDEGTPEITRLYANVADVNNHPITSSSSCGSQLRWYRGDTDGEMSPTTGFSVLPDTRYSEFSDDVSGKPVTVTNGSKQVMFKSPMLNPTEKSDSNFERVNADTESGQWYARNGRYVKRFPRMGCGRGSSNNNRSQSRDWNDWLPLPSGRIEDDSMLTASNRHRYRLVDDNGSRLSTRILYAPLQRSDTTVSGLWYSHVDTAF